jgi:hypothetical protein
MAFRVWPWDALILLEGEEANQIFVSSSLRKLKRAEVEERAMHPHLPLVLMSALSLQGVQASGFQPENQDERVADVTWRQLRLSAVVVRPTSLWDARGRSKKKTC